MNCDIIIVGVGGQGTLLASKILGRLALDQGRDVKVSEVHGMAQRGGSVITHVRMGERVHAPLVSLGEADYVLAFEYLEAARARDYLRPAGRLIANTQQILPMPVIMGAEKYPGDALAGEMRLTALDALSIAKRCGSARAVNIVLLGVLSTFMDFPLSAWEEAVAACVPQKTLAVNRAALRAGREAAV